MFPLARQRVVPFLVLPFIAAVQAREDALFTSSVTYCNPPETLLIQQFDVLYFRSSQTVSFNISVASVQANVNVSANLFLNVYGLNPFNFTIDLCTIFDGALCPLPMYNFTGADSLRISDNLDINSLVPSIAYKIPDLEGFAQLTMTEIGTGQVKACIQSTLSNGWSTHQPAVQWTMGAVTIGLFLLALAITLLIPSEAPLLSSPSVSLVPIPWQFMELFQLFQLIAASCLLDLNYPSAYRGFTLNFSWALGLIPMPTPSSIQNSIDNMRRSTGGTVMDSSGSVIEFVNRRLSPYNNPPQDIKSNLFGGGLRPVYSNMLVAPSSSSANSSKSIFNSFVGATPDGQVQTVTDSSANVLQAGIPIYVNSAGISTSNTFMTVFLICLMLLGILFVTFGVVGGLMWWVRGRGKWMDIRPVLVSWFIRWVLIMMFPLVTFAFYQWTLGDSWLASFIAAITFVCILGFAGYIAFIIFRTKTFASTSLIPHSLSTLPLFGILRTTPKNYLPTIYTLFHLLFLPLLRSILIAFAQSNGIAQLALLLFCELASLLLFLIPPLQPYAQKKDGVFGGILASGRVLCVGMMISFVQKLGVAAIPRVIVGFVISVVWAVLIISEVAWLVGRVGVGIWRWWRWRSGPEDEADADAKKRERGEEA